MEEKRLAFETVNGRSGEAERERENGRTVSGSKGVNGRKKAESVRVNGRTVSESEGVNGRKEAESVRVN